MYSRFENISIDDYNALFSYKRSHFYNFCVANNLKNLKEIFEFAEEKAFYVKNKYSRAEVYGIINILKYVYLNEKNDYWNKINRKCISLKSLDDEFMKSDILYTRYHELIRGFGFNRVEAYYICERLNFGLPIGDAIVNLYRNMLECKWTYRACDFEVTLEKMKLFSTYYLKMIENNIDEPKNINNEECKTYKKENVKNIAK